MRPNPIYREVIPRELTFPVQATVTDDPAWYVGADGALQVDKLLAAFQAFFREHSEHWVERFQYKEAGPQLLLQAFLQRIVNSGERIEREYGLGRMRTDLLIVWPSAGGPGTRRGRSSSARCCAGASTRRCVRDCGRRGPTWTVARPRKGTS